MIKGSLRAITFLSIIAAAVFYVVIQINSRTPSEHQNLQYPSKMVEVITAKKIPFRARSIAYGNVDVSMPEFQNQGFNAKDSM